MKNSKPLQKVNKPKFTIDQLTGQKPGSLAKFLKEREENIKKQEEEDRSLRGLRRVLFKFE